MFGYRVKSRLISRQEGKGEVLVTYQGAKLELPLDVTHGVAVSFRDPHVSWEEKCRLQYIEGFIPRKDIIKLVIFMHFGGMYYRYDAATGTLHICRLPSYVTGGAALVLALLAVWWRMANS